MVTKERREAFRFFLEHAGWIVGERARCALELARTEELLEEALEFDVASLEWVDDEEPYDPGDAVTEEEARKRFASNEWTGPYGCIVGVGDEVAYPVRGGRLETQRETTESLWGIVVGSRGTNDPYCRVVAAELASELEDDLRQAIGDARDASREI